MYKLIMIFMIFLGILLMTINVVKTNQQCPKQTIIYKYIPRTHEEELNEPVYPTDIFKTMFSQPSPWIAGINEIDVRKLQDINKYFVSQY
jgi:hypothetical protein